VLMILGKPGMPGHDRATRSQKSRDRWRLAAPKGTLPTTETGLPGWACRTRTRKRHFERPIENVGRILIGLQNILDQRLFAFELPVGGYDPRS
jgi:hypothetical protein